MKRYFEFLAGLSTRSRIHALVALVVACNYFSFRVEVFDAESDSQYHDLPCGAAFANNTVTWETFDKDNASQAFTVEVLLGMERVFLLPASPAVPLQDLQPFQPVRDKSPPSRLRTFS